jgi:hypothetical protein
MNKKRKLASISPEDLNLVLSQDDADSWNVKYKLSEVRDLLLDVIGLEVMVDLIVDFIVFVVNHPSKYYLNVDILIQCPNPFVFDVHDERGLRKIYDIHTKCCCVPKSCGCVVCTSEQLMACLLKFFPTKKRQVVPDVSLCDYLSACLYVHYPSGTVSQTLNVNTISTNWGFVNEYGLGPMMEVVSTFIET